jgi:hypothetical protein
MEMTVMAKKLRRHRPSQDSASWSRFRPTLEELEHRWLPSTFTVTTTADGGAGSLRQAIRDANANPGADMIHFRIESGVKTITPMSPLPTITDPVVLDGTTQPGYAGSPLIELNGSSAGAGASGLHITAGNSTVRGLVINRFVSKASFPFLGHGILLEANGGNMIAGNFIGTDVTGTQSAALRLGNQGAGVFINGSPNNTVGGTTPAQRNLISGNRNGGVRIEAATSRENRVQGNLIGTDVTGTQALGNSPLGVQIVAGQDNTIGGTAAGAGNVIAGNLGNGLSLVSTADRNLVQGNFLGTDVTGTRTLGNTAGGVSIVDSSANTIGGTTAAARNVVSANGGAGVALSALAFDVAGNLVQGNLIGTDVTGTRALGNSGPGVTIHLDPLSSRRVSGNGIGGTTAGAGNTIAFNAGAGVEVRAGTGNALRANSIFANGGLGIDLAGNSVTANDPADADTGPNNLQNFPVLTAVRTVGGTTTVQGTLASTANTAFRIELFASDTADPSGSGEGKEFLGATTVTTAGSGSASFTVTLPTAVPAGFCVSATATDAGNNTSEFARCAVDPRGDVTAPAVTDVIDVTPDPRTTPVPAVEVVFTEPIHLPTFTFADLTLTRNTTPVTLSSAVQISLVSGARYRISGLDAFTRVDGAYTLTVHAAGIQDLGGHAGTGMASDLWVVDATPVPASVPLFTDTSLTTPGLVGSYVNRSLRAYSPHDDWRLTQVISGTRIDPTLSFVTEGWGSRAAVGLTGGSDSNWENFSVQWDGWVQITRDNTALMTHSDDGSRMWIDVNGDGVFASSGAEFVNNNWGSGQAQTLGPASEPFKAGTYRIRIQYEEEFGGNRMQLLTDLHTVRVAYVIPSNRVPQSQGVANLQYIVRRYQEWYRDEMERNGFGAKTFLYETQPDGVTPQVHVVYVTETDADLRGDLWGRTLNAATAVGVPVWTPGQVWLLVAEAHLQNPDGSIIGGVALGGSAGSSSGGGVGLVGSDALALATATDLADDRAYDGLTDPRIGPYTLRANVSFPWFVGPTFSSVSSSWMGAALHEMSHGLGLGHDIRDNDGNFHGNVMGYGPFGFRNEVYPTRYPHDEVRLGYAAALALNVSRYFVRDRPITDNIRPTLQVRTSGVTNPINGQLRIEFTAFDAGGLSAALLRLKDDAVGEKTVGEMPLSGTDASTAFTTPEYTPGADNNFTISVYDTQGNVQNTSVTIRPATGFNRAPRPFVKVLSSTAEVGKSVVFDASLSSDPDQSSTSLTVEWDLNGDGVFETQRSTVKTLTTTFSTAGTRLVRVRVTDLLGAQSVSTPIAVRLLAPDATAPAVHAGADSPVYEGDAFTAAGSFTDPGVLDTFTATVNYGDGSGDRPLSLNADRTYRLSHAYSAAGTYTVTVTVTDDKGLRGTDTVTVTVLDYVVTNTNENGPGSLRQAILNANAHAGLDTITFRIGTGTKTIAPTSALPVITDLVFLDGTTQPGFAGTPLVELNGAAAGTGVNGLVITAGNSTVRGLVINRFGGFGIRLDGSGNEVHGCYLGTDVTGTRALGNGSGLGVFGSNNTIGGTTAALRNVLSGNGGSGLVLQDGTGNVVQGNYVGADSAGFQALGNTDMGVLVFRSDRNTVGGTAPGAGNVIFGNGGAGIVLDGGIANVVQGNFIGTQVDRPAPLGNAAGIVVRGAAPPVQNTVGGTAAGAANRIALNRGPGVILTSGIGNAILANAILANAGLGIDLVAPADPQTGVTLNDPSDSDTGPNHLQNYPVLTSVTFSPGTLTFRGTLTSTPNTAFRLEFFANSTADPSGFGEGQAFVGSTPVTTDGNGTVGFVATFQTFLPLGPFFSATATDPGNNTSEFSFCLAATSGLPPASDDRPDPVAEGNFERDGRSGLAVTVLDGNTGHVPVPAPSGEDKAAVVLLLVGRDLFGGGIGEQNTPFAVGENSGRDLSKRVRDGRSSSSDSPREEIFRQYAAREVDRNDSSYSGHPSNKDRGDPHFLECFDGESNGVVEATDIFASTAL